MTYLADHSEAKHRKTAESIGLKPPCTRDYLNDLISGGHRDPGAGMRSYQLKWDSLENIIGNETLTEKEKYF